MQGVNSWVCQHHLASCGALSLTEYSSGSCSGVRGVVCVWDLVSLHFTLY